MAMLTALRTAGDTLFRIKMRRRILKSYSARNRGALQNTKCYAEYQSLKVATASTAKGTIFRVRPNKAHHTRSL